MRLRVLIADDDPIICDVVGELLGVEDDLELVGVAGDAVEAVTAAEDLRPDVVLVDVMMPGGGGPAAARGIATRAPGARVVAYSGHEDRVTVRQMLRAGAVGFAIKGGSPGELVASIREAAALAPRAPGTASPDPPARPRTGGVRVLLVHQDATLLEALADGLEQLHDVELVGLAQSPAHARSLTARHRPGLALLAPGSDGLAEDLEAEHPELTVAVVQAIRDRHPDQRNGHGSERCVIAPQALEELAAAITGLVEVPPSRVGGPRIPRLTVRFTGVRLEHDERPDRIRSLLGAPVPMAFQPMVSVHDRGAVAGYEALARFGDGRTPDVVFAEAHRHGVGEELELHALTSALSHLDAFPEDAFVSINLCPEVLLHPDTERHLEEVPGERVVIELTEHAPVRDYRALGVRLTALRRRGFRIAVDDCGAGFSSLRHVVQIAPDFLKLDVVLCRDVRAPVRWAMARALAGFAVETGATAVAEGVEVQADLDALAELGVPLAQGWLLGHPVAAGA